MTHIIKGTFEMSNGETVTWRFDRDNGCWHQWGADTETLWVTTEALELMVENLELFELLTRGDEE